jgi:prepilin-type N-terminal cleavage/methylation domain-containing protein
LAISPLCPLSSSNSLKGYKVKKRWSVFDFFNWLNCFNLPATKVRFLNRLRVNHLLTRRDQREAFTLIELLVVIAIIAILIGLLFPAFRAVQNQAKQTQAKNDLTQIVNAVNAFYTEYGKYPLVTADNTIISATTASPNNNSDLFYTLRAQPVGANTGNAMNPRGIVFITPPYVKNDTANQRRSGVSNADGRYYDPWGTPYLIEIDGGYDNQVGNPYTFNAGPATLGIGVIAWSLGSDQAGATTVNSGDKNTGVYADDVISWQ